MSKSNQNQIEKIANLIVKTENNLNAAHKENFSNWLTLFVDYVQLNKLEKKSVMELIIKTDGISKKSVQNKISLLNTAMELKIDAQKYTSFRALELSNKNAKSGSYKVLKSGKNKGTTKFDAKADNEKQSKAAEILSAKNEAIELIAADAKFIEFMKYAKEQKMNLNYLRLAIK